MPHILRFVSLFPYEITAHLKAAGGIKGEGENAAGIFQERNHF
jgi:hypothetical protein